MPLRRRSLPLACAVFVATTGATAARCPPAKSEGEHAAAGATVFTGRVRALAPSGTPFPAFADLEVAGSPGRVVRVHAPDNGLYTASFAMGRSYRVIAYPGARGLSTSGCWLRPQ